MKLIFLDIDGVLNSDLWYKTKPSLSSDLSLHLDPRCIALLNKIITKTAAKVILSSTWRHHYALQEIQAIFKEIGFKGEIIAITPDLVRLDDNFVRGNEILKWCKDNEETLGCRYQHYKDYVILDDKNDMLYWQKNHFFQSDRFSGLTPTLVTNIIRFLS